MEPVLILVDTDRISQEKTALNEAVPYLQAAYDAFTEQSLTVTIQDLVNLKQWASTGRDYLRSLEDFVSNQLIDKATPAANFNGVPIQREKLKDLIIMPDLSAIKTAINTLANRVQGYNGLNIRPNLLVLNNGVIAKVADADAQLTSEFTYYTKTDTSAQLATDLLAIGQLLGNAKSKYNHYAVTAPVGLVWRGNSFGLDLTAIRNYEGELSTGGYLK